MAVYKSPGVFVKEVDISIVKHSKRYSRRIKIGKIFGEIASFVMKGILPYVEFTFGHILKTLGDALDIDLIKNAGEQMISGSFVTDGKRNEALIAMAGGEKAVQQQMGRGNRARAENNDTGGFTYGGYAATGAAAGAAIGSIIPGVGTAIGALVGGFYLYRKYSSKIKTIPY